jgi:hypothetical protein
MYEGINKNYINSVFYELEAGLGCNWSSLNSRLFTLHDGTLIGIIASYVDILYGGSSEFEHGIIRKLPESLNVGIEQTSAFRYIGITVTESEDMTIKVNQNTYIDSDI